MCLLLATMTKKQGMTPSWEVDYMDVANNSGVQQVREVDLAAWDIEGVEGRLEVDGNEEDEDEDEIGGDEGDFSDFDLDD